MSAPPGETLYLIDAHSLIFQVFHAIANMTSPAGLPTNAVFGFTRDLMYLRNNRKPTHLVCVFDLPGPTFRDKISADYKAHRAPMPDDLQLQIPLIHELLEAMRIPVLGVESYEADDVIATLATQGAKRGMEVFICSSDKDFRQLLSERVRIFSLRKQQAFDREALLKDWGVTPEQVIDYQTLVGDSVDNVKGVPGIGPKTASQLLQQFGTLDNLLARVEEITGKKKENLLAAKDTITTGRQLVRLETAVPMEVTWDAWRVQPWDGPKLLELFRGWGFRGFADQVRASIPEKPAKSKSHKPMQGSLFGEQEDEAGPDGVVKTRWQATYRLVQTAEQLDAFLKELRRQPCVAVDLATTSAAAHGARIVGLAFCWREGEAHYVAVRGPADEAVLPRDSTLEKLRPILEDPAVGKVNQDIKFDWQALRKHGIHLRGVVGDPMVADYLLHAGERSHGMDVLAEKHLQHHVIPISDLLGKGKTQKCMDEVPIAHVTEYAGEGADVAWRLCVRLEPLLQELGFKSLYDDLEVPLIEVLADMEFTGMRLDVPLLQHVSQDMTLELEALEQEIHRLAGQEFNIASVKQLREILFDQLGFKTGKKTAITGAASTDQETLEKLARAGHELPQKLLQHRQIAKLKGTYVDAFPALVNPATGRIHASFNQTVAATGRLSSSDPNLQNIPIRTEQGGQIRQAFLPADGWSLLTADYSQIELRLLAHFCQDEALRQAFAEDRDIHASVSAQVFGVEENAVTSAMRRTAKMVNFGVIYGISAFGLAQRLEITKEEAGGFIDAYFARYPRVLAYQDRLLAECRKDGYVRTILGRRRAINGIRQYSNYKNRNQPEREAINMQIQGSAADLIKIAMVSIHRRLEKENRRAKLLLQIHDELVLEVPPEEVKQVSALVREEMTGALADQVRVPLKVDMGVGPNWLDVEEVRA